MQIILSTAKNGFLEKTGTYCVVGGASFNWVTFLLCPAAIGTAGINISIYKSYSSTLPELERLEKAAATFGQVMTRYESELDLAKMRRELDDTS